MKWRQYLIVAAVFLDLIGFTMVVVDVQTRAESMGAQGWLIGLLIASAFIVQSVASPLWGAWSDCIGRKTSFTVCTSLSATSLLVYALAPNLAWLFISRFLSGLGSANVAVAQASVVDDSSPDGRAVALGRLSAALTAGMVVGPALGGWIGSSLGSGWVGYIGAAASGIGVLSVALFGQFKPVSPVKKSAPFRPTTLLRDYPRLLPLVVVASVAWFALSTLEGTFGRLLNDLGHDGKRDFGIIFSFEALVAVIVQATLLGWLGKRFSAKTMLVFSYIALGIGVAGMPFAPAFGWFFVTGFLFSFGTGIANPTVNNEISRQVDDDRQGEVFGVVQSARAIGFAVGPILGGALFDMWNAAPYLVAGLTCVGAAALVAPALTEARQDTACAP